MYPRHKLFQGAFATHASKAHCGVQRAHRFAFKPCVLERSATDFCYLRKNPVGPKAQRSGSTDTGSDDVSVAVRNASSTPGAAAINANKKQPAL
jgi:hypothetical protein